MGGWPAFFLLLVVALKPSTAQYTNCDYFQNVLAGQTYYVYSKNYPGNYSRGLQCRWQATCPVNTICRLTCSNVNIPATTGCTGDRLLVSTIGDPNLVGADKYCGKGTMDIKSKSNKISVGLITTSTTPGGSFYCTLKAEAACSCGWKKTVKIVGGAQTDVNEFPMAVGLIDTPNRLLYCGGAIIDTRWVLTAAHCLSVLASNMGILYGDHNIKIGTETTATKLIKAALTVKHPSYTNGYDYDIGLVKTDQDIVYSGLVGPACLPFKYATSSFAGVKVEAVGWGTTSFAGADSDYLQKVSLDVIDQPTCTSKLVGMPNAPTVTSRMMCTFTTGKDTCQHDSGGPLLYQEPQSGREYLLAVVVGGYGCATSRPSINTRVVEYLPWIQSTTNVNFCNI